MKKHYMVLDSFRGICACIVAFSHFNANSIFYGSTLLDRGSPYVDFFFVLSGFIIFANYEDKLRNGYSIKKFMLLRLGRLYPLHFAVLMAFILVDVLQLFINIGGASLYPPFSAPGETPSAILAMLFLVHSLHITEILAFNGPSWSISTEFYAYLLFAVIISYSGKYCRSILGLIIITMPVLLYFCYGELYAKLDYGFLRCIYGFACGALTWQFYRQHHENIYNKLIAMRLITALEIAVITIVAIYIAYFSFNIGSFFAPIIYSAVILLFSFEAGKLSKFLQAKFFLLLGTLSYSIYMVHLFISGKFFALPIRLLENKLGWNLTVQSGEMQLYGTNLVYGTLFEFFYLGVVVACSYISYKLIEQPFRNLTRKLVHKKPKHPSEEGAP